MNSARQPALFFSYANSLEAGGGGVQRCTRDYVDLLERAGFNLSLHPYSYDRSIRLRILRRLLPRPYRLQIPENTAAEVEAHARRIGARYIFLNHGDAAPLAADMSRRSRDEFRYVLLSHGLDSTDFLHESRIQHKQATRADQAWLGAQLFAEQSHRTHLDAVLCLSDLDQQLESWLGVKRVLSLPQLPSGRPLVLKPEPGRLGTVATLHHAPNHEGIVLFAKALEAYPGIRLRVVGRPETLGRALALQQSNIDYLGSLNDAALELEAATWSCFVNPIFCYGRGASTKLSQALGWRLPIASTRAGARGYQWDESLVPLADSPSELAALAYALTRSEAEGETVQSLDQLIKAMPGREQNALRIAEFLRSLS